MERPDRLLLVDPLIVYDRYATDGTINLWQDSRSD
jgi:hypothetical protein